MANSPDGEGKGMSDTQSAPPDFSYDLSEEMLDLLRKEFDPPLIIGRFAELIAGKDISETETEAEKFFTEFGRQWMNKTVQLHEKYPDTTYEVLKEAAARTGELVFPHFVQRCIEIAYLSTQQFLRLPVPQNYAKRLVYRVPECYMFRTLNERCGSEAAGLMPCRHACLAAGRAACEGFNIDATVSMEATTTKDGYCQFAIDKS